MFYIDSILELGGLRDITMCCIYDYQPFNYAYYGDKIVCIQSIHNDVCVIKEKENIPIKDLKPIMIDNDTLKKCKPTQCNIDNYDFEFRNSDYFYKVQVFNNHQVKIICNDKNIIECKKIDYLHILQNLVRGITGHLLCYCND